MKQKTFIFYGISGSGKGTQAKLLELYLREHDTEHEVLYLSTGKHLRVLAEDKVFTGQKVNEVLNSGGLLPAFLPVWVWTDWLIEHYNGTQHLIFDGLARRASEAPILAEALSFYGIEWPYVVLLNISREEAARRLKKRGRADDTDEDITRRLDWFESEVAPAIDFFKNAPGFHFLDIDGEQTVEKIHEDIVNRITRS